MSEVDYGQPAPEWLRKAEIYNLYDKRRVQWLDEHDVRFPVTTHVPISEEIVAKYHAKGTRAMPYVNFMELRALADAHADWIRIGEDGELTRSVFGIAYNIPDLHFTCLNHDTFHEFALARVRTIMDMGYDGVFVDNVCPLAECHGDRLGKHEHSWKDKSNTECYFALIEKIYGLVKSYGADRAVMINSVVNDDLWKCCDAQMDEGVAYGGERTCKWTRVLVRYWKAQREAARHGKVPVMLNGLDGLGGPEKILEGVMFTYACCRLFDLLWADGTSLLCFAEELQWGLDALWPFFDVLDPLKYPGAYSTETIYNLRLGEPLGETVERDFLLYRKFANGVAVLNADDWTEREIVVPVDGDGVHEDVYAVALRSPDPLVRAAGGKLVVKLAPGTGRIYVPHTAGA